MFTDLTQSQVLSTTMQLGYTRFNKEVLSEPCLLASASAHIASLLCVLGYVRELGDLTLYLRQSQQHTNITCDHNHSSSFS